MNELSLFSGAGGGLLATQHLLGWRTVGYVEINEYCQAILAQRIADGLLDPAPIFGDIKRFIGEGYAHSYRGMVDVVTAGFPCQPFSVAGKRKGKDDERNMWPSTFECIRIVGSRYVFLENIPGLLAHQYFGTILGQLAESGYCVRWRCLSAAEVGANHRRNSVWIVGHSFQRGCGENGQERGRENVADTKEQRLAKRVRYTGSNKTEKSRLKQGGWWTTEPTLGRVAHGVAHRVDRLKAIGEGQVPAVVAVVWELLADHTNSARRKK